VIFGVVRCPFPIGKGAVSKQYKDDFMTTKKLNELQVVILKERLENHRGYVSRQWQYFATFILLNGLLVNAFKELGNSNQSLLLGLCIASILTSAVFFHLINWTYMRIYRNARKITETAGESIVEMPNFWEGITPWLLLSIIAFSGGWIAWLYQVDFSTFVIGTVAFLMLIAFSIVSRIIWSRKPISK
jgi:hypothetical protein